MSRLCIDNLYLEVTRNCTLECAHCFRGEREDKYISSEVIDKVFNNVGHIRFLLLSGGEPLLAIEQLEMIVAIIRDRNIKVDRINVVTNGTLLSPRILNVLKRLSDVSDLLIAISEDKFHMLELQEKGLLETRDKNIDAFKSAFKVIEYKQNRRPHLIQKMGRANDLTPEFLSQVNMMGDVQTKYILGDEFDLEIARGEYEAPYVKGNRIANYLYIDVNGNIVPVYCSFKEEDENVYSAYNSSESLIGMVDSINRGKVFKKV